MTWKNEIRKKDDLEKRYEIAYQNFESESKEFLLLLKDVMNTDYHYNAISDARIFMRRFERSYGNMENILKRIKD
tara:strand:+ start:70 stop:294 length:225 start_codon:yes stop_codon:yes gene_type:complete